MFYLVHVPQKQNFFVERCFLAIQFSTFGHLCTDLPPRSTYQYSFGQLTVQICLKFEKSSYPLYPRCLGRYWQCVQVSL